ncbi:Lsr2 family protein [Streptomyces alfalfae]|uniref:histone-like nucleoid-structuring protein Lsr2 n=1 Tax=Streptomyces alfalfae TaxID=1642299 RepID=UPI001BA9DE54|nr:Lsr2 family protein [Streptomyces alfalfae]QUI30696.1 Lsr2 family protein [Streptomyces alfalfae]
MAQRTVVLITDDISGGDADETLTFGLDGKSYEIDLNKKNAKKLREALARYVEAGRRTGGRSASGRGRSRTTSAGSGQDTAAIRAWAKENGFEVNDRGRVPASVREAYEKANG